MGFLRVLYYIVLVLDIIVVLGYIGIVLIMLPDHFNVDAPRLALLIMGIMILFADAMGILAAKTSKNDLSLPKKTPVLVSFYIFMVIAIIGQFLILIGLLMNYVVANTSATTGNNVANDLEYCCVFFDRPGCPGVPCVAGHKTQPYQLVVDWRFLMFFWTLFSLIILNLLLSFLILEASPKTQRSVTLGSRIPVSPTSPTTSTTDTQYMGMGMPITDAEVVISTTKKTQ
jgi:hypothetical protein